MRLMENRTYIEGDQKVKGVPYTEHMIIDKHGNVQPVRADRHQRDWPELEYERGAIIVNMEPLGDVDVPNGRGGFKQVSMATVSRRLEEYKDEIARRHAANVHQIEVNRSGSPESRGKTKAARAVSEAMAEALKGIAAAAGGTVAGADLAAIGAQLKALADQNAAMAAELADLRALREAPSPAPEPRKK